MTTMKALLKERGQLRWTEVARPGATGAGDVEVRVERAGICRTDLFVARGLLASADPVVLGHEFAGVVTAVGDGVENVAMGDRVTAAPLLGCGRCSPCAVGQPGYRCLQPKMLGVDVHGAFAQYITLPAALVYRLPDTLGFDKGAYVEPVAASLAVVEANILPSQRGVIFGGGRIAELTRRIMAAHGFDRLRVFDPERDSPLESASLDFIVETRADDQALAAMCDALRPGATLVLKSRPNKAVALDLLTIVRKELRLQGAHYGPFERAIELLAGDTLVVDDLFGPSHDIADFEAVFKAAWADESLKHFFSPNASSL
ncbi:MAG: alcohol dehydrogenase catalytic domain-containing protein [Bradymonadaceae bacterium]|nr:alcohol dehydrogenase catalytic domain-containing protein [Lujinxingiaceae bacterium]